MEAGRFNLDPFEAEVHLEHCRRHWKEGCFDFSGPFNFLEDIGKSNAGALESSGHLHAERNNKL